MPVEMMVHGRPDFREGAGSYKTVERENSGSCPNAAQYYGRLPMESTVWTQGNTKESIPL
jgi:hypothetical protein